MEVTQEKMKWAVSQMLEMSAQWMNEVDASQAEINEKVKACNVLIETLVQMDEVNEYGAALAIKGLLNEKEAT